MEKWLDITGYEDSYQISNYGRVKSKGRYKPFGRSTKYFPSKMIKLQEDKDGYHKVGLSKNGKKKRFMVHRLVAIHFIENKENLPLVNHLDGNKQNNHVGNLEWCDNSRNIKHAFEIGLRNPSCGGTSKSVIKLDLNTGEEICRYKSISEAARENNCTTAGLSYALNNKIGISKGFKWCFVDERVTTSERSL